MSVILAEEGSMPRPARGHDEGALAIMAFRQVTARGASEPQPKLSGTALFSVS
jgi:hypothetical protein